MDGRCRRAVTGLRFLAVVSGAVLLAGCGGTGRDPSGDTTYELRFAHVTIAQTPKGQAALEFERAVERESGGRIQVEIFPNSELYGDEDELQAIQSGAVQVLAPSSSKFTKIAPELQVLDLPFLFDTVEDVDSVLDPSSEAGKAIFANDNLASRNIKVLALWDNGFKQLSANRPITGPESLVGLTFRIQPSDVLRSQFAAWGAGTVPVAFGGLYEALRLGVVDGQENTWSNIETQNIDEVQKYVVQSDHGYLGYVLVINRSFYDSLPTDLQKVVTHAADDATAHNRRIALELNRQARRSVETAGTAQVVDLTAGQRRALRAAVVPAVWKEYSGVIGPDLVDTLLARAS